MRFRARGRSFGVLKHRLDDMVPEEIGRINRACDSEAAVTRRQSSIDNLQSAIN
jgi:hypothetical protein